MTNPAKENESDGDKRSAQDVWSNIGSTHVLFGEKLKQCQTAPLFQRAHHVFTNDLRVKEGKAFSKANGIYSALQRPNVDGLKANQEEINRLQQEASKLQQSGSHEHANHILKVRIPALQQEVQALQTKQSEDGRKALSEPSEPLNEVYQELLGYFEEATTLLRDLTAKEELTKAVRADFTKKALLFQTAGMDHRKQAGTLLCWLVILAVMAVVSVFILFLWMPPSAASGKLDLANRMAIIENIVLVGAGRVGVLLVFLWAIKYTANLHRRHSEQAVIYRDRQAALGVAELILDSMPELDQRRELLRVLAENYLNIEQSAFRVSTDKNRPAGDVDIQKLKEVVETVRPLLEPAKGLAEKIADKLVK